MTSTFSTKLAAAQAAIAAGNAAAAMHMAAAQAAALAALAQAQAQGLPVYTKAAQAMAAAARAPHMAQAETAYRAAAGLPPYVPPTTPAAQPAPTAPSQLLPLAQPVTCTMCGVRYRWAVATYRGPQAHLACRCGAAVPAAAAA